MDGNVGSSKNKRETSDRVAAVVVGFVERMSPFARRLIPENTGSALAGDAELSAAALYRMKGALRTAASEARRRIGEIAAEGARSPAEFRRLVEKIVSREEAKFASAMTSWLEAAAPVAEEREKRRSALAAKRAKVRSEAGAAVADAWLSGDADLFAAKVDEKIKRANFETAAIDAALGKTEVFFDLSERAAALEKGGNPAPAAAVRAMAEKYGAPMSRSEREADGVPFSVEL